MKPAVSVAIGCVALLAAVVSPALASSPSIGGVAPRGGQRGTEVELTFNGGRLLDAQEVLFYQPGLTVKELTVVNDGQVKAKVQIAPDAKLGEHPMRLRCASGVTEIRTFWVGALPVVAEVEPNTEFKTPQKIAANVTVAGVVENEDVDYFLVEAKKGERITAEIEGIRLGDTLFDPYVSIMDMERFDLAASDDSALALQDPVASAVAPADGTYVVQVRESSYAGAGNCFYRLHVGTFPRPRTAYPAGGQVGMDLNVQLLGDVGGPLTQSVKLPAAPTEAFPLFAEQNGQTAPSPCFLRVSPFGNVLEAEPNNEATTATKYEGDLPIALNGVIGQEGDVDWFRFKAKKGAVYDINVFARRLRSPLDAVLVIANATGGAVASNDDAGGPDAYVRFTVPEDGEYTLYVNDHLARGSVDSVYRVEVTPVTPKLTMSIPMVGGIVPTQERQVIVVPKGNRFATLVRATRGDFGGDVAVDVPGLPDGVTFAAEHVQASVDATPVVFEATAAAAVGARLVAPTGKPADPNVAVAGTFAQAAPLVIGPNNTSFYDAKVDKLVVAVAEEAPFKINVVQPKVPLVREGSLQLKVTCERKPGFTAPINVKMISDAPGCGSGQAQIPGDKNETVIPLTAGGDAQTRTWKFAVLGWADLPAPAAPAPDKPVPPGTNPGGTVWVSSQLADLTVAEQVTTGKIDLAATEQGKPAQVVVHLENKTKYDGEATLKLLGLPNAAATTDVKIKAGDAQTIFNVTTDPKTTPVGQHNTLICQLVLEKDGEQIVQNLAGGGVLRVDAPPPPQADAPAPPPPPAEAAPPQEKPLTRLEKLRLEAQQKQQGK